MELVIRVIVDEQEDDAVAREYLKQLRKIVVRIVSLAAWGMNLPCVESTLVNRKELV